MTGALVLLAVLAGLSVPTYDGCRVACSLEYVSPP
jgi:hypothetical protein